MTDANTEPKLKAQPTDIDTWFSLSYTNYLGSWADGIAPLVGWERPS